MRFEKIGKTTARAKNEAAELDSSLAFLFVSTDYQDEGDLAKIWRDSKFCWPRVSSTLMMAGLRSSCRQDLWITRLSRICYEIICGAPP